MIARCPHFSHFSRIKHAFFEEDREPLEARKSRVMRTLAGEEIPLVVLNQVHGNTVISITDPWDEEIKPRQERQMGDALVTHVPGIALGVETADCGPVLFYDPEAHVIGVAHAGWKGARAGILQATIAAMETLGARRATLHATLGPTIQHQDYEVGPEFPDLIGEPYTSYFYPAVKPTHHHFNLPQYIHDILQNEGITHRHDLKINSFTSGFSSRRRTLSPGAEGEYFSGLSALVLL